MTARKRRNLILLALGLISALTVAWRYVPDLLARYELHRRADWVRKAERELKELARLSPPKAKSRDVPPWRGSQVILLEKGWAVARVHTIHEDPFSLSGLGDLIVMVDDKGRVWYSQRHMCSGDMPRANPDEVPGEFDEKFSQAFDVDAYLAAFSLDDPWEGWTTDRSALLDDIRRRMLSLP